MISYIWYQNSLQRIDDTGQAIGKNIVNQSCRMFCNPCGPVNWRNKIISIHDIKTFCCELMSIMVQKIYVIISCQVTYLIFPYNSFH